MVLIAFGATGFWARQQDVARRAAETRADAAEAQLISAQALLTAVTRSASAATATAVAEANQPQLALRRALDLVFAAYKDPSDGRLQALSAAFSPDALSFERTEAEHLISGGLHLGGATPYDLQVVSTTPHSPEQTEIATHEVWTYDEYDGQNHQTRCVREESDQTYTMERVSSGWMVQDVQLSGTPRRTDC
ncbi:MAG: hypothetical protein JOZ81_15005 [Chloroflexi bacterium]|nr:hypothetical protein [Chloroflexota bacterium]